MSIRPSFNDVAFQQLEVIAQRSTCLRLHTAALIATKDDRVIATGYNGSLPGQDHCDDVIITHKVADIRGCLIIDNHCVRTIHAEMNAITQAAKYGSPILGCKMYCLHVPCLICTKLAISAGIQSFYVLHNYGPTQEQNEVVKMMTAAKVQLYRFNHIDLD